MQKTKFNLFIIVGFLTSIILLVEGLIPQLTNDYVWARSLCAIAGISGILFGIMSCVVQLISNLIKAQTEVFQKIHFLERDIAYNRQEERLIRMREGR